jgi:hypothetical protein
VGHQFDSEEDTDGGG